MLASQRHLACWIGQSVGPDVVQSKTSTALILICLRLLTTLRLMQHLHKCRATEHCPHVAWLEFSANMSPRSRQNFLLFSFALKKLHSYASSVVAITV